VSVRSGRGDEPPGPGARRTGSADPRSKLFVLLAVAVATALSPAMWFDLVVMGAAAVFALVLRRPRMGLVGLAGYAAMMAALQGVPRLDHVALRTMLGSFGALMRTVLPCGLVAAVTVSTTPVGEFMSALNALRLPRQVVVPLAIMLRYAPTVRADWASIRDAMRLRGIGPGPITLARHPVRTIECVYVPLLMSASTAADELSMAAVARGIENPARRTCCTPIGFGRVDVLVTAPGIVVLVLAIVLRVNA